MSATYVEFDNGVRLANQPDARGYHRVRWIDPSTGKDRDARRRDRAEAEQLARELAFGLSKHREAATGDRGHHENETLLALVDHWADVNNHDDVTPQYLTHGSYTLRRWVNEAGLERLLCGTWDASHTRAILQAAANAGLKPSSREAMLRLLKSLAKHGRNHGWLSQHTDPCGGITLRVNHGPDMVDMAELPTAADIDRLADMLVAVSGEEWRHLQIQLLAYSGMRTGELLGLDARHIDLEQGTIRIERQYLTNGEFRAPKYGSIRTGIYPAWLDGPMAERVAAASDGPLFPARHGGRENYRTLYDKFKKARDRAHWPLEADGSNKWTLHDLRHYFCTWALAGQPDGLGLDVADVSRFAGHKNTATTWRVYVQSRPDRVSRAREASRKAAR